MTQLVARPWYREPWPWIVMAAPVAAVLAGIVTIFIAFRGADGLVADDYYKEGLAINRTLARSEAAAAMGLQARLDYAPATQRLVLALARKDNAVPLPRVVRVQLAHPHTAAYDHRLEMVSNEAGEYVVSVALPAASRWMVVVESAAWRLQGEWPDSRSPLELRAVGSGERMR